MSRDLPPRPNLDHLKKQAKELLQTLKQQSPDAQLADAQHALAREYGFASWPRLTAHVEGETAAQNPFVGKWTADISRSKLHPLNRLKAASMGFDVEGADVTIDYVMVDESGRTDRAVNTFTADGKEHPSNHRDGFIMRATWLGSHSLEAVVSRDGEVEGRVEYIVSPDGNTLTLSASWRGGVNQMSVFTRANL
jgi:glyoxalase superfamily protein